MFIKDQIEWQYLYVILETLFKYNTANTVVPKYCGSTILYYTILQVLLKENLKRVPLFGSFCKTIGYPQFMPLYLHSFKAQLQPKLFFQKYKKSRSYMDQNFGWFSRDSICREVVLTALILCNLQSDLPRLISTASSDQCILTAENSRCRWGESSNFFGQSTG